MHFLSYALLFFFFTSPVHLSDEEFWARAVNVHKGLYHRHLEPFSLVLSRIIKDSSLNITPSCRNSLDYWSQGLREGKRDATLLFDSCGFGASGSIRRLVDLGHYKQCLNTHLNGTTPSRYVLLETHWPSVTKLPSDDLWTYEVIYGIKPVNVLKHINALCIPNACIESDIKTVLDSKHISELVSPLNFTIFSHETEGEDFFASIRTLRLLAQIIVFGFLFLSVLGTLGNKIGIPILTTFDAISHHRKLVTSIKSSSMSDRLAIFKLFRAAYVIAAILGHSVLSTNVTTYILGRGAFYWTFRDLPFGNAPAEHVHLSSVLALVTSSCLTFIILRPVLQKMSISKIVFLRAIKFLPLTGFMLLTVLSIPLNDRVGQGPLYLKIHLDQAYRCLKTGLYQLFFMSNSFLAHDISFPVLWLHAVDMQCFLLSLAAIWVLKNLKSTKIFFVSLAVQVIIGNIIFYQQMSQERRFPLVMAGSWSSGDLMEEQMQGIAWKIEGWISVYPVGFILGYLLMNSQGTNECLEKSRRSFLMAAISIGGLVTTFFIRERMYNTHDGTTWMSRFGEVLVASQSRFLMAVFAAMCFYYISQIRLLGVISNHPIVSMLSKLSFPAFLTHSLIIPHLKGGETTIEDFTPDRVMADALYVIALSFISTYLLFILVESPLKVLTTKLFAGDYMFINKKDDNRVETNNNTKRDNDNNHDGLVFNHDKEGKRVKNL